MSTGQRAVIVHRRYIDVERTGVRPHSGTSELAPAHLLSTEVTRNQEALKGFIATFATPDDLKVTVLPIMEKSLLRSPEHSLNGASAELIIYTPLIPVYLSGLQLLIRIFPRSRR